MLEPGDIVLVPFPFADLSSAKTRPALVLSAKGFQKSGKDVVVCAMTSNLQDSAHSVLLGDGDLAEGRLPKPTRVKAAKLVTLQQDLVRRRFGRLNPKAMAAVWREFGAVFP